MNASHCVHCSFCNQTYITGPGDCCGLCGKAGGLSEAAPVPWTQIDRDRQSWTHAAGPDQGTVFAASWLGILAGAVIGVVIAFSASTRVPTEPTDAKQADEPASANCGLSAIPMIIGRFFGGVALGGAAGGILSIVLLVLLAKVDNGNRRSSSKPPHSTIVQQTPAPDSTKKG